MNQDSKKIDTRAYYFLLTCLVLFLGLTFYLFSQFSAPLFFALLLSILFYPLHKSICKVLDRKLNSNNKVICAVFGFFRSNRKHIATLLILLLTIFLVLIPLVSVISVFINEAGELYTQIQGEISEKISDLPTVSEINSKQVKLNKLLGNYIPGMSINLEKSIREYLLPALKNISSYAVGTAKNIFGNALLFLVNLLVLLIGIFFLLNDAGRLGAVLIKISPLRTRDEVEIFSIFRGLAKGIVVGNTVTALVQGLLLGLGFYFFSLPRPVFFGVIGGFLSFIPFFGTFIVWGPGLCYLIYMEYYLAGILFLLYCLIVVSGIDNVIKPYFISDHLKLNTGLILVAILSGIKIFGVMGIFYGPLIVAIFQKLIEFYLEELKKSSQDNL
ncbi:MAG: AI-2E family transporter [Candidatus Wallbacteria bacterium]|nr:AI-2E family transporter [Candidatus Wallbacteria bacterium]